MAWIRKNYKDMVITDYLVGYVVESKREITREEAWYALDYLWPNKYDINDLEQLSAQAWAVYD